MNCAKVRDLATRSISSVRFIVLLRQHTLWDVLRWFSQSALLSPRLRVSDFVPSNHPDRSGRGDRSHVTRKGNGNSFTEFLCVRRWTRRRWRAWCCSTHTSCSARWCRTVSGPWRELIRWAGAPTLPLHPSRRPDSHRTPPPPFPPYALV